MIYATRQDILDREGADALYAAADRNRDGQVDVVAVDLKLADASAEIDTFLSLRYPLPLATVPPALTRLCIDITLYRLSLSADVLTKELRQRYEDAISLLNKMSRGDVGLGIPVASEPAHAGGEVKGDEILITAEPRLFTRNSQRGL